MFKKFHAIWQELKERNVIRIAMAYAVTAWMVVQIGDIVFPVFEAPDWIMRVLIILLLSGFPLALLISWFYEWTQTGLKKSSAIPKENISPPKNNKRINQLILIAFLIVSSFFLFRKMTIDPKDSTYDSKKAIAIFPFSVQGSESIQYLSEGMVNLISIKLDNIPGLNAIDPNILLSSVAESKSNFRNPEIASQLAVELGANKFILGSITEVGEKIEINLSKYDASGRFIGQHFSETGDIQALYTNVDNIIQRIVAEELEAEGKEFASDAIMTTKNLASIVPYLKGEQYMRKGQYKKAVAAYKESVKADSLFILSYYRMFVAMSWVKLTYDWPNDRKPVFKKMKKNLDRLSGKNKEIIDARIKFITHHPEVEENYRRLIKEYGESQALIIGLAETLFHLNESKGRSPVEAKSFFQKMLKYDSLNEEVKFHLMSIALYEQDLSSLNYMVSSLTEEHEEGFRFKMYALVLSDSVSEADLSEIALDPNLDESIFNSKSGMLRLKWYDLLERMSSQNIMIKSNLSLIRQKRELATGRHLDYLLDGLRDPDYKIFSLLIAYSFNDFRLLDGQENKIIEMVNFLLANPTSKINMLNIQFISALFHHSLNNKIEYEKSLEVISEYLDGDYSHYAKLNYYQLLGQIAMNSNQNELGLLYFDSAANVIGNDSMQWVFFETLYSNIRSLWKAELYFSQGNFQRAKSIYEVWTNSGDYGILRSCFWGLSIYRLGLVYEALGEDEQAIYNYKLFLKVYKDSDHVYDLWKVDASRRLTELITDHGRSN